MARQQRQISQTDCYHVVMRGNNKSSIFNEEQHKKYFIKCLHKLENENEIELMAWCVMDNHVHLVVKVMPEMLEHAFKRLNIKYAMYYHRTNKSVGHVFQDRFKSETIESDASLMNVVRYVHNNPVKAKMVDDPEGYFWSSYHTYMNKPLTIGLKFVWQLFGNQSQEFVKFHDIEDDREYLEIKEDQERFRLEKAQKAIDQVCDKHGKIDRNEIFNRKDIFEEIVKEISRQSHLSGRKIAGLIGVSEATVRKLRTQK